MVSFQRSATTFCTAMPPPSVIFRPEKSSPLNASSFSRATNSVLTPVNAVKRTFERSLTKAGMSRGLVIRRFIAPSFMKVRQFAVSAKM